MCSSTTPSFLTSMSGLRCPCFCRERELCSPHMHMLFSLLFLLRARNRRVKVALVSNRSIAKKSGGAAVAVSMPAPVEAARRHLYVFPLLHTFSPGSRLTSRYHTHSHTRLTLYCCLLSRHGFLFFFSALRPRLCAS